jgi:hypothetical protein
VRNLRIRRTVVTTGVIPNFPGWLLSLPATLFKGCRRIFNLLTLELNPSAQRCLTRFFTGIVIFKGLIARRLYKSFVVKGLTKGKGGRKVKLTSDIFVDEFKSNGTVNLRL